MLQAIEAIIEKNGTVRLLEPFYSIQPVRAILTILESADKPAIPKCSLHEFVGVLQHSSAFVDNPVAIQQAMRDEWN